MRIDVLTLFPDGLAPMLEVSILGRARAEGRVQIELWDVREFTTDRHRTVDDTPFGGGAGMVLKPEPVCAAVEFVRAQAQAAPVIMLTPQGERLTQQRVEALARRERLILLCGHYEGFDERIRELVVDEELSIGDYVLTGGELPALVVIDAVSRLLPGVLGSEHSAAEETFAGSLLEYPHYTRPRDFRGRMVPEILLSGHHAAIARWRREQSLLRTWSKRPDLLREATLDAADRAYLAALGDPDAGTT